MPMTEPLTEWALNVSHPFLEYYDAQFLEIDTLQCPNGIASTVKQTQPGQPKERE